MTEHPSNADIMKSLDDLKAQVQPVIDFYENMTFSLKAVMYFLGFITVLGTAIAALYAGFKYIKP